MAQLIGVQKVSEDAIEYGGFRYERVTDNYPTIEEGDIVRNDAHYTFLPEGAYYVLNEFGRLSAEDDDLHDYDRDENVLFRKVITTSGILTAKRTQLATLTAEIAQLEAQIAEESRLKVGDYARVTDTASVDEFTLDDVVVITRYDGTAYPLRGECPVSGLHEWFRPAALTKITPTEARASLIAKIDAHFGGQEAK